MNLSTTSTHAFVQKSSIRTKLLLTFGMFLLFSVAIATISVYYQQKAATYVELTRELDHLSLLLSQGRKYEKDFLLSESVLKYYLASLRIKNEIKAICKTACEDSTVFS